MKRIVTVQDISCVGKCSATVALPIISAMGVECGVIPTAVLSTHTMFSGFTFHDLTCEVAPILDHWKKEGFTFDAIYTGYLGSFEQLQLVERLMNEFPALKVIDPVMADNGKLYTGFTMEFVKAMAHLCGKADIIVPNMTEASFMLGIPYVGSGYDEAYVKTVLKGLCALGTKYAVLTGVDYGDGKLGVACMNAQTEEVFFYFRDKIDRSYHGTGDVYASTIVGALMNGKTLEESLQIATDYTVACIARTAANPNAITYGVEFEAEIPYLIERLHQ